MCRFLVGPDDVAVDSCFLFVPRFQLSDVVEPPVMKKYYFNMIPDLMMNLLFVASGCSIFMCSNLPYQVSRVSAYTRKRIRLVMVEVFFWHLLRIRFQWWS